MQTWLRPPCQSMPFCRLEEADSSAPPARTNRQPLQRRPSSPHHWSGTNSASPSMSRSSCSRALGCTQTGVTNETTKADKSGSSCPKGFGQCLAANRTLLRRVGQSCGELRAVSRRAPDTISFHFISEARADFRCQANAQALDRDHTPRNNLPERGRTAR